jgi:dihydroorotate dehydrogenase electron transfer subunit
VYDDEVKVRAQQTLGPETFLLTLEGREIARAARPGQFVMLRPSSAPDPLLRRPMSFCNVGLSERPQTGTDEFQILYHVVGTGTKLLSRLMPGDSLFCLGPLGRGFRLPETGSGTALLVAGGIGIAPFPFLVEALSKAGASWQLIYGARSSDLLIGREWFRGLGKDPKIVTEDGSSGERGLVTGPLGKALESAGPGVQVYACGPDPMLRAVARICAERRAPCQVSLEGVMPCGFGVCLGCSVPAAGKQTGFLRICTEGPVFDREEIGW